MISIFVGAGGCLDCRLSSTSGVMSHYMSSDATTRKAAGTSLTDKWRIIRSRRGNFHSDLLRRCAIDAL